MSTPTLSPADVAAHEAGSYVRVSPEIRRAVVRYEIAAETVARLSAMDARTMSGAQFDLLASAQDELAMRRQQLADAGRLHLVEVAS